METGTHNDKANNNNNSQYMWGKDMNSDRELVISFDDRNDDSIERESVVSVEISLPMKKVPRPSQESVTRNNRLLAGMAETKIELGPVIGYAEEPLLPLGEACAPLNEILHDLSFYVQMALDETPYEPPDGLTIDESAAIRLYTIEWESPHRSLYSMLNYTLKNYPRDQLRPYFKYLKLFLTALAKLPCLPPTTVWRGVTKDLSDEFSNGTLVTWWAFSSCTTELTVLDNQMYLGKEGERTLFSVEVFNGRTIRAHSHFVTEDEILLLAGTHMEVQSLFSPADNMHIVHLKQLKPVETLLEPPFEGAQLYPPEPKKRPWYKKPRTIIELIILIVVCIVGIIVGAVIGTRRPPPPPLCFPPHTIIRADYFWSFDCGDAREDFTGLYNGSVMNGADFVSPGFTGRGKSLQLNRLIYQYVSFPRSLNLTLNTSFTLSAWILLGGYRTKNILTDCNNYNPVCIAFIITDTSLNMRVLNWDNGDILQEVSGSIQDYNCQACWMYVSFVYNHLNRSAIFYLNGMFIDQAYLNLTYPMLTRINKTQLSYIGLNSVTRADYFYGLIDQLNVLYSVKPAVEIKYEATILFYYDFDTDNIRADAGPNNISGITQEVYRKVSNNDSALVLNTSESFFQALGFTLLASNEYEFSVALWFRLIIMPPTKPNSAIAVLQLSSLIEGLSSGTYSCSLSLHVYPNNGTIGVFFPRRYVTVYVNGSSIKNNTWTHFGMVYDSPDRYLFYINGQLVDYDINRRYANIITANSRFSLSIGGLYLNNSMLIKPRNYEEMKCFSGIPVYNYTKMYGEIDDVTFHARVLDPEEFAELATTKNISNNI